MRPKSTLLRSTQSSRPLRLLIICLLLLAWISLTIALPTNSTLIPDGDGIILDVGQKVKLSKQNWGLGIVLILFGLIEVFYGFKFIRLSLIVTGFLLWATAAMVTMVAIRWDLVFTTFSVKFYYFWVWFLAGVTGATLSFRYWDLGVTFSGAFGGFAVAMGIIAIANIAFNNAGRYVLLAVLILSGAAFATFFERIFIILSTSFGGAYIFMFGVDQFVQVGYREMIVIFDFTGKTLTYHPSWDVYLMIGLSLILAGLGIAWEFWHHETPVLLDRKAVFRIYGRPFGKRPRKLVGQKIHYHLKTTSDVYVHIMSCFCFQRWTIDDLLYDEHIPDNEVGHSVPAGPSVPTIPSSTGAGSGSVSPEPVKPSHPLPESKSDIVPSDKSHDVPIKTAPVESRPGSPLGEVVVTETYMEITDTNTESTILERQNRSRLPGPDPDSTANTRTTTTANNTSTKSTTETNVTTTTATTTISYTHTQSSNHSETHPIMTPLPSSPGNTPSRPPPPGRPEPQHPLFSQNLGEHAVRMLRLVTDDTSPENTLPPISSDAMAIPHHLAPISTVWRTVITPHPLPPSSTASMNRHMLDLIESIETSRDHRLTSSEDLLSIEDADEDEDEEVENENEIESEKSNIADHWPPSHTGEK
ncbi:hypothetical protein FBU30_003125 [Linnemannia zychae]|nr:hypothetical protein FBU30_003125 [Linnemannia zychae]